MIQRTFYRAPCTVALLTLALLLSSTAAQETTTKSKSTQPKQTIELLTGNDLSKWTKTNFGGESDITLANGVLKLSPGSPFTGITWKDKEAIPTVGYEIQLEARRISGTDFFCGLTFPYKDSHCSFILGGWGGGLVGLSCIDGYDASENETTSFRKFERNRWYKVRVRITENKIEAWIDQHQMADVEVGDKKISVRDDIELSRPLGVCSFETTAEIRHLKLVRHK